jgi:hypothetical protein
MLARIFDNQRFVRRHDVLAKGFLPWRPPRAGKGLLQTNLAYEVLMLAVYERE